MTGLGSFLKISLILALLFNPKGALATLGEPVTSIEKDRKGMSAVRRSAVQQPKYSIHPIDAGGITVREYALPSGVVFAVGWSGNGEPDLSQLLGSYHPDYLKGLKDYPRKHGHRSRKFGTKRMVVEKWGHMRSLHGHAYLPALLPSGVSPDEIK